MDETLSDLVEDFERIAVLCSSAIEKSSTYEHHLERSKNLYPAATHAYQRGRVRALLSTLDATRAKAIDLTTSLKAGTSVDVTELIQKKKQLNDVLRPLHSELGSILTAGNWQSPSFGHTMLPQNGDESSEVGASMNDYKRDMHSAEKAYGALFAKEYIEHPLRLKPHAFPTSSGMSAVTTVLNLLRPRIQKEDVVLVGKSAYFQCKWAIERLYAGQIVYVDEFDTEGILALAKKHLPAMVFLDSLCNSPELPLINLKEVVPQLAKILPRSSTLVIDNTCMSVHYQPLNDLPLNPFGMQLIVVESLLKYHQFGLDRVSGGIVWAPAGFENELFGARMHLGTIIPDVTVQTLPTPNRAILTARLNRIGRNTRMLAEALARASEKSTSMVSHVVYPSLPTYPGYAWTKDLPFHGGFLVLAFKPRYQRLFFYDLFIARIRAVAKRHGIDLISGSSFGFDTTRIYVAARYTSNLGEAFIRISAGTETLSEITALADVLTQVIAHDSFI